MALLLMAGFGLLLEKVGLSWRGRVPGGDCWRVRNIVSRWKAVLNRAGVAGLFFVRGVGMSIGADTLVENLRCAFCWRWPVFWQSVVMLWLVAGRAAQAETASLVYAVLCVK